MKADFCKTMNQISTQMQVFLNPWKFGHMKINESSVKSYYWQGDSGREGL